MRFLSFLLFMGLALGQRNYYIEHIYEEDGLFKKKYSGEVVDGKIYESKDGIDVQLGIIKNGLKEGKWVWWHTNGNRHKVGYYPRSVEDSLWQWWHVNGNLKMRGNYKNSIKQGRWNEWNDEGVLISSSSYLNGTLNGKCINRY